MVWISRAFTSLGDEVHAIQWVMLWRMLPENGVGSPPCSGRPPIIGGVGPQADDLVPAGHQIQPSQQSPAA